MKVLVGSFNWWKLPPSRGLFCDCGTSIFTKVCFSYILSSLPGHSQRWRGGRPSGNWYPETAFKDSHLICCIFTSAFMYKWIDLDAMYSTHTDTDIHIHSESDLIRHPYISITWNITLLSKRIINLLLFFSDLTIVLVLIVSILFMKEWLSEMPCLH